MLEINMMLSRPAIPGSGNPSYSGLDPVAYSFSPLRHIPLFFSISCQHRSAGHDSSSLFVSSSTLMPVRTSRLLALSHLEHHPWIVRGNLISSACKAPKSSCLVTQHSKPNNNVETAIILKNLIRVSFRAFLLSSFFKIVSQLILILLFIILMSLLSS